MTKTTKKENDIEAAKKVVPVKKMTIAAFENSVVESFKALDLKDKTTLDKWIKDTLDEVILFHKLRDRKADDPSTAQAKSFSAIRKGIYADMPKVKTGDAHLDKQESRWNQTRELKMTHPDYDKLVLQVDPISLLKYNKASKQHNVNLRERVDERQTEAVQKFSIKKCMESAFKVIQSGMTREVDEYTLFVALLYATGRRQQELFDQMKFTPVSLFKMSVSAFAKTTDKEASVVIPCLFDSKFLISRIIEVRKSLANKTSVNAHNKKINEACHKLFPEAAKAHQLRALYAETCDRLFNNTTFNDMQLKTAVYKKNALNHGNIKTANEHYEVISEDLQSDAEVNAYLKEFKKMNSQLKSFVPLDDEIKVPKDTPMNKRIAANIQKMLQKPEEITFKSYFELFGGTLKSYNAVAEFNEDIIENHNDLIQK